MTYQEETEIREEREGPRAMTNEPEALDAKALLAAVEASFTSPVGESMTVNAIRAYLAAREAIAALSAVPREEWPFPMWPGGAKFKRGDRVTKTKGSSWTGRIVGFYCTALTPIGYDVESENEPGSVQLYPEAALAAAPKREA